MSDFKKARQHMVESQLHPGGVVSPALLEVFALIPREKFLPEKLRGIAYVDEDIIWDEGKYIMEPLVLGRMLQAADPREDDIVLNIGDMTGYAAAIISSLVSTIVVLETKIGVLDKARQIWTDDGLCNIAVLSGEADKGCPEHAPYSLIVLNGAVPEIPEALLSQLSVGGRLVAVVNRGTGQIGQITLVERSGESHFSRRILNDATTPYVWGEEKKHAFAF